MFFSPVLSDNEDFWLEKILFAFLSTMLLPRAKAKVQSQMRHREFFRWKILCILAIAMVELPHVVMLGLQVEL